MTIQRNSEDRALMLKARRVAQRVRPVDTPNRRPQSRNDNPEYRK